MHNHKIVLISFVAYALAGCALQVPRTYADPKEVTVAEALKSVAVGISEYNDELIARDVSTANIVDQVEVTLNVTASAKGTSELVVEAKAPEAVTVIPFGVKYTDGLELQGNRGSIVKLTLKNLYTANLNKPGESVARRDGPGFRRIPRYSRNPSSYYRRTTAERGPDGSRIETPRLSRNGTTVKPPGAIILNKPIEGTILVPQEDAGTTGFGGGGGNFGRPGGGVVLAPQPNP